MTQRQDYYVHDPDQLEALASPVRQEIMDTVIALGRCTVREVAEALGRPADGLYYHVRRLEEVGLVRRAPGGEEGGAGAVLLPPTSGIMYLVYEPVEPDRARALDRIVRSMTRMAASDFREGYRPGLARCSGPERNLNASRQRAWLGPEERTEVNRLLARLQEIFSQSDRGAEAELRTFTFVLAPAEPRPVRREGEGSGA